MSDPAAVLRSNRRRSVARRVMTIVLVPVMLVALVFSAKLLSMYAFAYRSGAAYAVGDFVGTEQAARWQEPLNLFEPYKAPFNVGVGLAAGGDLAGARAKFEEALALATGLDQCAVRVNLAIVIERTGDAALEAGNREEARSLWQEALLVMMEAPEGCQSPEADEVSPDPDQNMEDTVIEEERRLREKLEEDGSENPPPDEPQEPEESEEPDQGDLESIEEQLQQGTDERDDYLDGGDSGGLTYRPW
jgi:hypothetical protein